MNVQTSTWQESLQFRFTAPTRTDENAQGVQVLSEAVVSSVRVNMARPGGTHADLSVFNRGVLAGHLVVESYDAKRIAERLIPGGEWDEGRHP
jgi:hypothetical protein